jgi:hypothetical protein
VVELLIALRWVLTRALRGVPKKEKRHHIVTCSTVVFEN